jgi:DNA helicase-2/ATP-dependent DNA helicase PcrA
VNLLQQTLMDRWLGERDELCAVGDDYQSIYAFTGASPEHLLAMASRFPHAEVIRLEDNYRSTPEVLEFANRLVPRLGGAEKVLRATKAEGPEPIARSFSTPELEAGFVVERIRELHEQGTPHEEMAILFRTNARSADYEEALSEASIPSQGAALLARDAAKQLLKALRGRPVSDVPKIAREQGLLEVLPDRLGEREVTRQNDLARLVRLAAEYGEGSSSEFVAYLEQHFGSHAGRGVHLLTYHRAKGLEFEAVFLPRLEERELPSKLSKTDDALAEERRLLYVGLTRAKRHLTVTWSSKPSRFLAELQIEDERPKAKPVESDDPLYEVLKRWRLETAKQEERPAYVIFHNSTLAEIVRRAPRSRKELAEVPGVGPAKLERYGDEVLAVLAAGAQRLSA